MTTTEKEQILAALRATTRDNFNRARWVAIDNARRAGVPWAEIVANHEGTRTALARFYSHYAAEHGLKTH